MDPLRTTRSPDAAGPARITTPVDGDGDGRDFESLYRRQYPVIQRYVRRRLGDAHAVEDVVGETFLVAYQGWQRYEERGRPVQAWLYRLATSRIARHLRKRRPKADDGVDQTPSPDPSPDPASDSEGARRQAVREALGELPERLQSVLALHHLEGLSLEEVGEILRCRVGTVKSRLFRARAALRRVLERKEWNA